MLREVQATDAPGICHIYNPYILQTEITFEEEPLKETDINDRIQTIQRSGLPWLVTIEEHTGQLQGYAYASTWKARSAYRYTVETSIYLDPAWQGRGLGQALYQALMQQLKAQGIHSVIGILALPNPASIRLHEKLGFQPVGKIQDAGFKFNRWIDVGYWQLMLDPD
ncbi:MAG: GNAT family N-acetyltransferase [Prochlorotrichaceae cyanobacterium]|jgi:phosphinothricin acetyltransferase